MTTEEAVHTIVRVVSPYVGETMARSATTAHCQKLGIGTEMGREQLDALLSRLGSGLNIFLGREKSSRAIYRRAAVSVGPRVAPGSPIYRVIGELRKAMSAEGAC